MLDHGARHVGVNFGFGGRGDARPLYLYPRMALFFANTGVKDMLAYFSIFLSPRSVSRILYSRPASHDVLSTPPPSKCLHHRRSTQASIVSFFLLGSVAPSLRRLRPPLPRPCPPAVVAPHLASTELADIRGWQHEARLRQRSIGSIVRTAGLVAWRQCASQPCARR